MAPPSGPPTPLRPVVSRSLSMALPLARVLLGAMVPSTSPVGVAVDPSGSVWTADSGSNMLVEVHRHRAPRHDAACGKRRTLIRSRQRIDTFKLKRRG